MQLSAGGSAHPFMKRILLGFVVLAGCYGAHRESSLTGDDMAPVCGDVTCDAQPANTCIDGDTLRSYATACTDGACSYPAEEIECGSAGCCGDHCCSTVPSNATDFGDLAPTGLVVAPPDGTFDTDVDCVATSALGTCAPVTRTDLPQACVCRADEITIGTLKVKGARALVLFAKNKVVVQTLLDVSGDPGVGGPGQSFMLPGTSGTAGGVGGSFATKGIGGPDPYGEVSLVPLLGGMKGKAGGLDGGGGGGGGALQITAGELVEVRGVINAGGGGGRPGYVNSYGASGGSGGGSGGGILIEAPTVIVSGAMVANGGGGGGGGGSSSRSGGPGGGAGEVEFPQPDPLVAAYGGYGGEGDGCPLYGYVYGGYGGVGGTGTAPAGGGQASDYDGRCASSSYVGAGGHGGGVGRIRINTTTGCQCGGSKISPQASFGMLVKQ